MAHYSGREWELDPLVLARTRVWRVAILSVSGKRAEHKDVSQFDEPLAEDSRGRDTRTDGRSIPRLLHPRQR